MGKETIKLIKRCVIIFMCLVLFSAQGCAGTNTYQESPARSQPEMALTSEIVDVSTVAATQLPTQAATAAQSVTPSGDPDSGAYVDILPIDQGDGQVLLWAGGALASSSAGSEGYHAKQALGKPNTLACGRFVTAWQPAQDETEAWIELYYAPYILPNNLYIKQLYLPSQLSKVELVTVDEETITIFDREIDEIYQPDECPATRGFSLPDIEELISIVRITLERTLDEEWTQIGAVGVLGLISDGPTEPMETAEWVEDEYSDEDGDFYTPRYYSNKNWINALTFAGDQLWTASDGGVVSWDLETFNPTPYTEGQGLPGNATSAIAYCDWDYGKIVTGGAAGLAIFNGDTFNTLEHPDDEFLGTVTVLACDVTRQQLWVGYLGHLSRYDLSTHSWTEFGEREGMPMDVVRQIIVIGEAVWAATAYGVAVVRGGDQLTAYTPDNSDIPAKFVHAIAADQAGVLWMASSSGLLEFDGQTWALWTSSDIAGDSLGNMLMGVDGDGSGILWVADAFGTLCQFDPEGKKCLQIVHPPDGEMVLADFKIDVQGRMAVGGYKNGTWYVLGDEWFPLRTHDQALDNAINVIAYAPDGNLWVAGRSSLQYFTADQPSSPWGEMNLPENAQPNTFFVGSDGLWIGHTRGARFLPYLDQEWVDLPMGDPETAIANSVTAITVGQNGWTYFGTSSGLSIWDGSQFVYDDLLTDQARSVNTYPPRVNALHADGDRVWVGASNGLFEFTDGRMVKSWVESLETLDSYIPSVGVITDSPDGAGLLVAVGGALYQFDSGEFTFLLQLPSEIRSVYALPNALMLATAHSGLYSLPKDGFGIYWDWVDEVGLSKGQYGYQAITMSDAHTLWIASLQVGLQRSQALYGQ